jgi:SAM-dependent methyltransferase
MVITVKVILTSDRELVMPELTDLPALDAAAARDWIERWDRQQEVYMPDREERFTALIDAVEAGTGRPDPLVLDLGCGPGSLAVRLLARLPEATVVAVDADPVTLSLGRAGYAALSGLRFVDVDLREPGWVSRLDLPAGRPVDAVVSTTALHWLSAAELRDLYVTLAGLLRPGGVFLDGDHLLEDETASPVLRRLDRALEEREGRRRSAGGGQAGGAESWDEWWQAVAADSALAGAAAERSQGLVHHSNEGAQLAAHTSALSAAGFAEVGTLWQRGSSRVLCGVR